MASSTKPEPAKTEAPMPKCDVDGCGRLSALKTDGSEKDVATRREGPDQAAKDVPLNRPSIPLLFVCARHTNWPHSEDARKFTETDAYKARR